MLATESAPEDLYCRRRGCGRLPRGVVATSCDEPMHFCAYCASHCEIRLLVLADPSLGERMGLPSAPGW